LDGLTINQNALPIISLFLSDKNPEDMVALRDPEQTRESASSFHHITIRGGLNDVSICVGTRNCFLTMG
jgi:hypothetical protein